MKQVYGAIKYYQHWWLPGLAIDRRLDVLTGDREFSETEGDADLSILGELRDVMATRGFCICASGLFAMVSDSAHEDDEIYVPLGLHCQSYYAETVQSTKILAKRMLLDTCLERLLMSLRGASERFRVLS